MIIDTNILLDYPQIIEEFISKKIKITILTDVLKELDGLKNNINQEVSFKARRAAILLSHNLSNCVWVTDYETEKQAVDDKLILAAKDRKEELITNDIYLKIRAIAAGVKVSGYKIEESYTGVKNFNLSLSDNKNLEWLEYVIENKKFPDVGNYYNNEYYIINNTDEVKINEFGKEEYENNSILYNNNGEIKLIDRTYAICNKWINKITPKNVEQKCLFHALFNPNITILYAGGGFGCGKSFLLNNYAIQELEKGKIKKIVYIPNNSYTENTIDLGALPGELLDKTIGQIGPLIDLVGIDQIQDWLRTEQLEVVPMSFVRGRSFQDSIIIVNEAQNLTEEHVKLLIARCGQNTRIFFDGDLKQTDSDLFRNKNGLRLLLKLRKSPIYSKIFATVKLVKTERSLTAQAAQYLDMETGEF